MSSSGGAGNGVRALTRALLIVNTSTALDGTNACYAIYHRTSRELMLIDANGNAGITSRLLGTSPNASSGASSPNCIMDLGQSWYSESFSTERIVVPVTFSSSFINRAGTKNVFFVPIDRPGNTSSATTPNADQTWPATASYLISGFVGLGSTGLAGVAISLSGGQFNSTTTDSGGNYSFGVLAGRNYGVVPDLANYSFAPSSLTLNNVGTNLVANFGINTIEVPILPGGAPPGPPGPTPTPTPPSDVVGSLQMCNDLSGFWSDQLNNHSLSQNGLSIVGTTTQPNPVCGTVTWQTSGTSTGPGQFSLSFANGYPPIDSCGGRVVSSTANLTITSCSTASFVDTTPGPGGEAPARKLYPGAILDWTRTSVPPGIGIRANIYLNSVEVALSGPNKNSNLSLSIRQSGSNSASLPLNQPGPASEGAHIYSLKRLELTPGSYGTVYATWDTSTLQVPVSFDVIGATRYSTYNTPDSSDPTCSGPTQRAALTDFVTTRQVCHYEIVDLTSKFADQVRLNGSGVHAGATIIPLKTSWMRNLCNLPANVGLGIDDIFVRNVPPKTGSCNTTLGAGVSLAAFFDSGNWACGDNVLMVDLNTAQTNSIRVVQDNCPACRGAFGGQLAHIDAYSGSGACGGIVDTGNFFSIKLR